MAPGVQVADSENWNEIENLVEESTTAGFGEKLFFFYSWNFGDFLKSYFWYRAPRAEIETSLKKKKKVEKILHLAEPCF